MQRSYNTGGLESIDSYSRPLDMMLPTPTGSSGWWVCYVAYVWEVGRYPEWTISVCCVIKVSLVDWKCYGWAQHHHQGAGGGSHWNVAACSFHTWMSTQETGDHSHPPLVLQLILFMRIKMHEINSQSYSLI